MFRVDENFRNELRAMIELDRILDGKPAMNKLEEVYAYAETGDSNGSPSVNKQVAMVLANYDSQVKNGGHQQWLDNGYGKRDAALLLAIRSTDPILILLNNNVTAAINEQETLDSVTEEFDDEYEEALTRLDKLDDAWYALQDDAIGAAFAQVLGIS